MQRSSIYRGLGGEMSDLTKLWAGQLTRAGARGEIVERVDHPFLFRNPDMLYAEHGRLIAVFRATLEEKRSPDKLLARLVTSRLALPAAALGVLAVEDGDESELPLDQLEWHFDRLVLASDRAEWRSLLKAGARKDVGQLEALRERWWREFRVRAGFENKIRRKLETAGPREVVEDWDRAPLAPLRVETWTSMSGRTTSVQRGTKTNGVAAVVQAPMAPTPQYARSACITALRANFVIDSGMPYRRGAMPILVPIAAESRSRMDPGWVARVLAFSGAIPVAKDFASTAWRALTGESVGGGSRT